MQHDPEPLGLPLDPVLDARHLERELHLRPRGRRREAFSLLVGQRLRARLARPEGEDSLAWRTVLLPPG